MSKCATEGLYIHIISLVFNEFNKVKLTDSSDSSPSAAAAVLTTCCSINPVDRLPLYLFILYFAATPPVLFGLQLMMQSD